MSSNNENRKRPNTGGTGENLSSKKALASTPVADRSTATTTATPEAAVPANDWNAKLNMSPPKKTVNTNTDAGTTVTSKQDAHFADVEQRMREDEWGEIFLVNENATAANATDEQKIVHYLYGIEFYKDAEKSIRVQEVQRFLEGDCKERMMDLLKKDSDVTNSRDNVELWRKVQGVILRYMAKSDTVTIFDNKNMPVVLRMRATKNCYQHATGGTVGYKIAFEKGNNEHAVHTVDVAKTMRRYYNAEKLKRRVLDNKRGSSQNLLESMISGTGIDVGETLRPGRFARAFDLVTELGPALVARFCTDEVFKDPNRGDYIENKNFRIHQFDRSDNRDIHRFLDLGCATPEDRVVTEQMEQKNIKSEADAADAQVCHAISQTFSSDSNQHNTETEGGGLHAMILIGGRKDASGKVWFLIQNTWKFLPVFEASKTYLDHHLKQRVSSPSGAIVFLNGTFETGATAEETLALVHQGLCQESNNCDDVSEEEDEKDVPDSDLEE